MTNFVFSTNLNSQAIQVVNDIFGINSTKPTTPTNQNPNTTTSANSPSLLNSVVSAATNASTTAASTNSPSLLNSAISSATNAPTTTSGNSPSLLNSVVSAATNSSTTSSTNSPSLINSVVSSSNNPPTTEVTQKASLTTTPTPNSKALKVESNISNSVSETSIKTIGSKPPLSPTQTFSEMGLIKNTNTSLVVINDNRTSTDNLKLIDQNNKIIKDAKQQIPAPIPTTAAPSTSQTVQSQQIDSAQYIPIILPSGSPVITLPQNDFQSIIFYANHVTNQTTEYKNDLLKMKKKLLSVRHLINQGFVDGVRRSIKIQEQLQNEIATNELNLNNTLNELTSALDISNQFITSNEAHPELNRVTQIKSELLVQRPLLEQCKKDNTEILKSLNESIVLTQKLQENLKPQIDAYNKISQLNTQLSKNLKLANQAVSKSVKPFYPLTSLFETQNAMVSCQGKNKSDCFARDQHCIWLKAEQKCALKCNSITSQEACNKVGDGLLCAWSLRNEQGFCYHKY